MPWFAAFDAEAIAPMIMGVIVFMIPIIAILTSHQQKMARILRETQGATDPHRDEIAALRQEVRELRDIVQRQVIAMDSMMSRSATPPPTPQRLEDRVGESART